VPGRRLTQLVILLGGCVGACACAHPVGGALQDASNHGRVPADLVVVYDDRHAAWGGRQITVWDDGWIQVLQWRPGPPRREPEILRGRASRDDVLALVDRLVEVRAWEQASGDPLPARVRERLPPLDNGRVRLTVRVGEASSTVWEWANDVEARRRLVLVRQQLERLIHRARRPGPPSADRL
jgi:hypothetical protein